MRNRLKKIITSLFIALSALCVSLNASAAESALEYAANVLTDIGVIRSYESDAKDNPVTVGNAMEAVYNIFSRDGAAGSAVYSDIGREHSLYAPAYWAHQLGIDLGTEGILNPNRNIKAEELYKLLIIASDYDFMVGNQATPYTSAAYKLDNSFKILAASSNVTNGEFVNILYDFLFLPAAVNLVNHVEVSRYQTIMEFHLGIKYDTGIIIANEFSAVEGYDTTSNDHMLIMTDDGEKLVLTETLDYRKLVGCRVSVFYAEGSRDFRAVSVVKEDANEFVIDGEDFRGIDFGKREIYYRQIQEDNRNEYKEIIKEKKFIFGMRVVYNGQFVNDTQDMLEVIDTLNNPGNKTVERVSLLDTDTDGKYDTLIADVYRYYVPSAVYKADNFFHDMFYDEFRFEDENHIYINEITGEEIDISHIAVNGLVKIKEGLYPESLVQIRVMQNKVLGSFLSFDYDLDETVTAEVRLTENSLRTGTNGSQLSFVGGEDNQFDIRRYKVDNSLAAHIDNIMTAKNGEHAYNIILDDDNRIGGITIYTYGSYNDWNGQNTTTTTYNTVEVGIGLDIEKFGGPLDSKFKITVLTKPLGLMSWITKEYTTSDDFKVYNVKFGGEYKTVKISELVRCTYDELKELFIEELFELYFNDVGELKRVVLPLDEPTEGKLSRFAPKGLTYVHIDNGILRSSTTNDVLFFGDTTTNTLVIPKYKTADSSLALARMIQPIYSTIKKRGLYNVNAYTYSYPSLVPDFFVWIYDYSRVEILADETPAKTGEAVIDRAVIMNTDSGPVDAYYVMGGIEAATNEKKGIMFSVYGETLKTPALRFADNGLEFTSKETGIKFIANGTAPLSSVKKLDQPIESGDIVLFTIPFWQTSLTQSRFFTTAHMLYDYSTDTILDSERIKRGVIKDLDNQYMLFLPDNAEDKRENYIVYDYAETLTKQIICYRKTKSGGTTVDGTIDDLKKAYINGEEIFVTDGGLFIVYEK